MATDEMAMDNQAPIFNGGFEMLTPIERDELQECEEVISRGLQTFYEVGAALTIIRDKRLYKQEFATFEEYCRERWDFGSEYARLLMRSSDVIENLKKTPTIIGVLPENNEQAKYLAQLETPQDQVEAWERVVKTAPDGKITGFHVKTVVNEMLGKEPPQPRFAPRSIQDSEGTHSPDGSLSDHTEPVRSFNPPSTSNIRPALQPLMSSDTPEWYTPDEIITRTIQVLGDIYLDPCSNESSDANPNVPAALHYTQSDDGLSKEWVGTVYLNPPYGREIKEWVAKLVESYELGGVQEAIALLPARTDTSWMRMLSDYPRCFVWGRLNFSEHDNSAPFPSVVVYLGEDTARFAAAFSDIGDIYVKWRG